MDDLKTDFCIVGGGPAGLTLALLLLRSGVRVTLVERSPTMDREYRGEILQPGGARILDALGVLAAISARGACRLRGFQYVAGGRTVLDIDYTALPAPYNYLLSVPQRHILTELLAACERFEQFIHLPGGRLTELLFDGDRVTGAVASSAGGASGDLRIHARCVVGADGRYSRTRALAGFDTHRLDVFDQDLLWFKLAAAPQRRPGRVQIFRGDEGAVLVHDSYPDRIQLGWTLPHRGYASIAAQGIDHVQAAISRCVPQYAELIGYQIKSLHDLSLLDVFAAGADEWARDGLVLIGDAAHTHGPLGAQGINLAIQDAAMVHPVLLRALRDGDASAAVLGEFRTARQPDVDRVMQVQRAQAEGMFARGPAGQGSAGPGTGAVRRPPAGEDITAWIALGNPDIRVHADLFVAA